MYMQRLEYVMLKIINFFKITYIYIYFIHLPMKMEPIVSSETSAIRTQTPGNYPKRNNLYLYIYVCVCIHTHTHIVVKKRITFFVSKISGYVKKH